MKNPYLLMALLLCQTMAIGQSLTETPHAFPAKGTLYAKLNIISLADPRLPTIQPGIEYRFSKNMSGELTVGLPVRLWGYTKQLNGVYNKYYKVKAELKFAVPGKSFYIGPEVFYTNLDRNRYNGGFRGKNRQAFKYDYAEIKKTMVGAAFKIGRAFRLSDNWHIDGFLAAGVRWSDTRIDAEAVWSGGRSRSLFYIPDREGKHFAPHAAGGLKVMYTLF
jgi:hypothetical protein